MVTKIIKCDNCGKFTEDIYNEKKWIVIGNNREETRIEVTGGRQENGTARISLFRTQSNENESLHFCGLNCLNSFIKKLMLKLEEKQNKKTEVKK